MGVLLILRYVREMISCAFLAAALSLPSPAVFADSELNCLPASPIDCSASYLKVAPSIAFFTTVFENACMRHDYCYRFGAATYGYSKKKCDNDFLRDMANICEPKGWEWGRTVITAGTYETACMAAASVFYGAVKSLGSGPYKNKEEGKICRYEGGDNQEKNEGFNSSEIVMFILLQA